MATEGTGKGDNASDSPKSAANDAQANAIQQGNNEAPYYANKCQYPKTHNDSDLCAQWTAATAAEYTASWLPYQAKLGTIEAVGIGLSLIISTLSAIAGFTALRVSRRAEERQNRAYVAAEAIAIGFRNAKAYPTSVRGFPATTIVIKNSGQTPAYKLAHWGNFKLLPKAAEASLEVPPLTASHRTSLPPGGTMRKFLGMPAKLTAEEVEGFKGGQLAFFVWGRIEYLDAFGKSRFTDYRSTFAFDGVWPLPEEFSPFYSADGNDSD